MAKRRILYGYIVQNGKLVIEPTEAETVRQIFSAYLTGLSYQVIADKLNVEEVPFCNEAPKWNKHKVKRLLEDCRYLGEREYPPIVQPEIFERIKLLIRSKTAVYRYKTSQSPKADIVPMQIKTVYTPSAEVKQIESAINRALEQPDNPTNLLGIILQGITTRYKCIKDKEMID